MDVASNRRLILQPHFRRHPCTIAIFTLLNPRISDKAHTFDRTSIGYGLSIANSLSLRTRCAYMYRIHFIIYRARISSLTRKSKFKVAMIELVQHNATFLYVEIFTWKYIEKG